MFLDMVIPDCLDPLERPFTLADNSLCSRGHVIDMVGVGGSVGRAGHMGGGIVDGSSAYGNHVPEGLDKKSFSIMGHDWQLEANWKLCKGCSRRRCE
jgi:hypothetical protein